MRFTKDLLALSAWDRGLVVPILAYHAIDRDSIDHSTSPHSFRKQMKWLAESANIISLQTLEELLAGKVSIHHPAVITFDDGFLSVHEAAFPVLHELGLPFAVFLSTGTVGRKAPLQGLHKPMLSWRQVREMLDSGLMTLGSHTHSHRVNCLPEEITIEIKTSCEQIRRNTGVEPRYFAFPKGQSNALSRSLAGQSFSLTFAGEGLQRTKEMDRSVLERIGITNRFTTQRLRWSFSPLYWKMKWIRHWFA